MTLSSKDPKIATGACEGAVTDTNNGEFGTQETR